MDARRLMRNSNCYFKVFEKLCDEFGKLDIQHSFTLADLEILEMRSRLLTAPFDHSLPLGGETNLLSPSEQMQSFAYVAATLANSNNFCCVVQWYDSRATQESFSPPGAGGELVGSCW